MTSPASTIGSSSRPIGRSQRLLPAAGVLAAVLFAASDVLTWSAPTATADAAGRLRWFADHQAAGALAGFAAAYFLVVLLFLATALRSALRSGEAEESTYSTAAFGGAVLMAFSVCLTGVGNLAAVTAADKGVGDTVTTLGFLAEFSWIPWVASSAVMFLAAGFGGLRTAALPKWLSVVTIVLGVLCLTGPTGVAVFLVTPLWLIALGVVLGRRGSGSPLPAQRSAAFSAERAPVGQAL